MKTTEKSFVKQFLTLVEGDSAEALAQKVYRQVQAALNTQIAVMTGNLVEKEEALEDAKTNLENARLNYGKELRSSERTSYVNNLVNAKNKFEEAQEDLAAHKETLEFLKTELTSLES